MGIELLELLLVVHPLPQSNTERVEETDEDRENKTDRRPHQGHNAYKHHDLNQSPNVHSPHGHNLRVALVRALVLVGDGQPQSLPEFVSGEVGVPRVEEQTAKHGHWDRGKRGTSEEEGKENEQMDGEGGDSLLDAPRDACACGEGQHLDGPLGGVVNFLDDVDVAAHGGEAGVGSGGTSTSLKVDSCLACSGSGSGGLSRGGGVLSVLDHGADLLEDELGVGLQLVLVLGSLLGGGLVTDEAEGAAVVQRGDSGRDHPGAADKGEEDGAEAEGHHIHVVPSPLLQPVLTGVHQPDGDVLIEVHKDEAEETAQHGQSEASGPDVREVHDPRSCLGAKGGLEDAPLGHVEEVQVDSGDTVVANQDPCNCNAQDDGNDGSEVSHLVPEPLVEEPAVPRGADAQGHKEGQQTHQDAGLGLTVRHLGVDEELNKIEHSLVDEDHRDKH
mmetsp:Transcript_31432/g.62097  ORF Transcript_31432/g.62097 Transcript_31432/m.62097 type:complete len:444 (+) Transcript_31432:2255-3586(+)